MHLITTQALSLLEKCLLSLPASLPHPREVRVALNVSRELMARLVGVSAKTIERWEARPDPPVGDLARGRLVELHAIADLGRAVYTPQGLVRFLSTPLPAFAGHTPAQMIESNRADRVLAVLAADYEGAGV